MQTGQLNVGSGGGGGGGGGATTGCGLPLIEPLLPSKFTYTSQLITGTPLLRLSLVVTSSDSTSTTKGLRVLLDLFLASSNALGEDMTTSSSNSSTSIGAGSVDPAATGIAGTFVWTLSETETVGHPVCSWFSTGGGTFRSSTPFLCLPPLAYLTNCP